MFVCLSVSWVCNKNLRQCAVRSWAVLNDCWVDMRGCWCRFIILHERNGSALPQSCSLQHFWAINIPSHSFCHLLTSWQLTNQFCYVRKCAYLNQSVLFCLHVCNCNSLAHKEVTQNHFSYFSQNYLRYLLGAFKTSCFFVVFFYLLLINTVREWYRSVFIVHQVCTRRLQLVMRPVNHTGNTLVALCKRGGWRHWIAVEKHAAAFAPDASLPRRCRCQLCLSLQATGMLDLFCIANSFLVYYDRKHE